MATQPKAGPTAQQGWQAAPIFISYRRSDGTKDARALYESLLRKFGEGRVFIDLADIPVGAHFAEYLNFQLDHCRVLVALIGRDWAKPDANGLRRYDDEADFVRIEIGTAIRRGIAIFPVLTDDALPPAEAELPPDLHDLARRHALSLDFGKFGDDVARLARGIRAALDSQVPEPAKDATDAQAGVQAAGKGPAAADASAVRPSATPAASRRLRFWWPIGLAALALAVALAFSAGLFSTSIDVPDLRGKTLREASQSLQEAGLSRGAVTSRVTADVQRNTVIGQRPAAGTRVQRQQPVDLLIAEAPARPPASVPSPAPAPAPTVTRGPEIVAFTHTAESPARVDGTVSYRLQAVPGTSADKFFLSFAALAADGKQARGTARAYVPLTAAEGSVSVSVRAAPAAVPGPREFDTSELEACIVGPKVGPKDFGPTLVCRRFPSRKSWIRP